MVCCGFDNGSAVVFINNFKLRFILARINANRQRVGAAGGKRPNTRSNPKVANNKRRKSLLLDISK
eukprot:NODE_4140_length_693_cov_39.178571_g3511_i0.p2 GENE.NODE_4140_length_693_cov_39.178571_g3511_i0~~NODE_4140_length_693_cov_39.178571_g3511_i0.p2  ORF type:complete len:66 (-),score=14.07 NODE_4140_length_693_cov_39.178571_g3511_i0:107-304(-)